MIRSVYSEGSATLRDYRLSAVLERQMLVESCVSATEGEKWQAAAIGSTKWTR